jgi:hypothetical protein
MLKYRNTATRVYFLIKQFKKKCLHFFYAWGYNIYCFRVCKFPACTKVLSVLYTRCINNYYNTSVGTGETSYN